MRYLLLPMMACIAFTMKAQDKGFISGNFSFDSQKLDNEGDDNDETLVTGIFGPTFGFNITPKHVIGLRLNMQVQTYKYKGFTGSGFFDITEKQTLFEAAVFFRYMKSVGEKCSIYVQLMAGGGGGKSTIDADGINTPDVKLSTLGVTLGPGIHYSFADHWAITADWGLLGYASETHKYTDPDSESTISGSTISLTPAALSFGLNWLF